MHHLTCTGARWISYQQAHIDGGSIPVEVCAGCGVIQEVAALIGPVKPEVPKPSQLEMLEAFGC